MNYFNTMQHIVVFFLKENSFLLMELLLAAVAAEIRMSGMDMV